MVSRSITVGLVGLLVLALLVGSAYILLRPDDGSGARVRTEHSRGDGAGREQAGTSRGAGRGQCGAVAAQGGQGPRGGDGSRSGSRATGEPQGGLADDPSETWATLTATVVTRDGDELTVLAEEGSVVMHLGPEWYWETEGVALGEGDQVAVTGFDESGMFEVTRNENLATAVVVTLRDEKGRPLWAGRGRPARDALEG